MPNRTFDLNVRTENFALSVIHLFRRLPGDEVGRVLGRQLLRAGTSIGANYHEAARAPSNAEFIAKMGDSLKEANETAYWLNLISRAGLADDDAVLSVKRECGELIAIFTAGITTAKRNGD